MVRYSWPQMVSAALGIWLMAAPAVLGYGDPVSAVHRVIGPVVAAFAIVAIWGHMRPLRWMNLPLGAAVIVGSFVGGGAAIGLANGTITGLAVIVLGLVRGTVAERYGGGWSSLWTGDVVPDSTDDGRR